MVAIRIATGTPNSFSLRLAALYQLLNQPPFWSNTAQTSSMWVGVEAQPPNARIKARTAARMGDLGVWV